MKQQDREGMKLALNEARKALEAGEIPVGAVMMTPDGNVIAAAGNAREQKQDPTAHAEIEVIREAARVLKSRRLSDCTMYVTLEPCPMCAGAALAAGLKRIVYGACDVEQGCCGSVYDIPEDPAFHQFSICDGPFMEKECREILDAFFHQRRKNNKT